MAAKLYTIDNSSKLGLYRLWNENIVPFPPGEVFPLTGLDKNN